MKENKIALNDIIGGSINNYGEVDGANYQPTGFPVSNNGTLRERYSPVGNFDSSGKLLEFRSIQFLG